jgi:hypothetical protein
VVAMTDKPLTPEQIIIAEWRAKDAALVEAVEEVTIDWKAIAQTHNDSLVARIEENERLKEDLNIAVRANHAYERENERLRECLGFFASVIKSGEQWSGSCEREYRAALTGIRVEESALSAGSATYNERWKSKP